MFVVLTVGKGEMVGMFHTRESAEAMQERCSVPTRIIVKI